MVASLLMALRAAESLLLVGVAEGWESQGLIQLSLTDRNGWIWTSRHCVATRPGCVERVHLNNAGAGLMSRQTLEAVTSHLELEARIGGYEAAAAATEKLEHTYDALARLVGADRDEIAVVENATRAWDMAYYALPFQEGDRILTARAEYASNAIAFLQTARKQV